MLSLSTIAKIVNEIESRGMGKYIQAQYKEIYSELKAEYAED